MKSYQTLKMISFFLFWLFVNSCATNNTVLQTSPPDIPSKVVKASTIQRISFIEEENYSRIQMEGSETLEPPFYKLLSDPLRIAIDIPNIDLKQIKEPIKIDSGTVSEVLTTQFDDKGRIEIGLTQMTNYNIFKEDKILIIDIEKVKKIAEVKEEAKEEAIKEKEIEITPQELKKEETPTAPETLRKAKEILRFLFDQKKDFITFNIAADGKIGNYDAFKLDSPPRLVLDIWEVGTRYPKNLINIQNPFIKKVRIGHYPDKLRLVFECPTPQLPSYQINRIQDKLIISFGNIPQPSEPQIPLKEGNKALFIDIEKPKKVEAKIEATPEARKEEVSVRLDSEAVETKKEEVKEEVKKEEEKPIPELKKPEIVSPQVEEKPVPQPQVTKEAEIAEVGEEVKKEEEAIKEKETEITPPELKKEEAPPAQPIETATAPETLHKAKEILRFLFDQKKDFITFNIAADGKIGNYDAFKLDSPPRLVLDIWEVGTRYPKNLINIQNPFIKKVRIGHYPDKLRLVFECPTPQLPSYQINRIQDKLIISFGNIPQPSEPQIPLKEGKALFIDIEKPKKVEAKIEAIPEAKKEEVSVRLDSEAVETKKEEVKEEVKKEKAKKEEEKPPKAQVKAPIEFKQMDNKSRIVVSLTEEPQFESHKISKNTVAVDIKNAFLPKHLQKGLDTSEFDSAVKYIDLKNVKAGKANDVRILIKLREEVPFETTKEGNILFIDIEKTKKVEAKIEAIPEAKKEEVSVRLDSEAVETKKEEVKEEVKKEEVKKGEEKPLSELKKPEKVLPPVEAKPIPQTQVTKKAEEEKKASEEVSKEKVYAGRRLSLDFKDADIKNILRLIAEVSNFNIITGDDVTGKITMRLVDVPWDQALDVILQARSLGMSKVGNVMRIAPLDSLKKEIQAELEAKRTKEKLEDLVTELIPINYATAKEILPQVKSILSERGDIKVDDRTNILIVKDIPRNIALAKNLVKSLDTKTPQVLIEARIVEANLSFQRDLGISWGFLASTGTDKKKTLTVGSATTNVVDLPVSGAGLLEFLFTSEYGLKNLDVAISAYENKGELKVISSPKIATLDNKEASVEQGLRIPYVKLTTEGTPTEDFIEANLKLIVTPHVTNDGHVKMSIKVKKDEPDYSHTSTYGTPSINKKESTTEVLVKDNGVVVIAGIYTIKKGESTTGVPLFSKIPVLGWLFKKESKTNDTTDLLIFISPKILKGEVL